MASKTGTLRDALTNYRTQKSAPLKLDGNYFYRRSVPSASTNLYGTFPDLYDNSDDIHIIRGGQKNRASQFDATVAERPTFGAGDLSGLYFRARISAIDRTDGPLTTAGLKAFLLSSKIRSEGGAADGSTLIENEFVTAFSANLPDEPSNYYTELFDGVGEDVETEVEQGTLLVKRVPYITFNDAYRFGRFTGKKNTFIYRLSRSKFKGRWCTKHPQLGWICKVRQIRNRGRDRWETVKEKKLLLRRNRERFYDLRKNRKLKFMDEVPIPAQDNPYQRTLSNQINSNNSSMMITKQAKTFSELSSTGGVKEIAWGKIAFSSENSYEGGQSVKMHTFWPAKTQKGSNDEYSFRKTNIFYPADTSSKHTQQRQECYMVKRLPIPKLFQNMDTPTEATTIGHNIKLRMNIKQLAPCESKHYNRTTTTDSLDTGGWGDSTSKTNAFINKNDAGASVTQRAMERVFTRGLAVCFSEFPPGYSDVNTADSPDDTFYSFMKKHHPSMETEFSGGGEYAEDTSAKDFYGVMITQERGKFFAQSLGKHATQSKMLWLADPYTHKIGRADIDISDYADLDNSTEIDMGDRWLDYNFIVDTTSGVMELIIAGSETENEAGAEIKIPIYNSSGATTSVSGTFPKYMSIWLLNYPNPNSGMNSAKATAFGGLGLSAMNNFADTGLVTKSIIRIADPADPTTNPETVGITGGHMPDFTVQARNTGDSTGTNELYWNLLAGSQVYIGSAWGSVTYGELRSSIQSTGECKYGNIYFGTNTARTINPGQPILINNAVPIDGNATNNEDMESIVYVDAIKLYNFGMSINNATVSQENSTPGSLKIPSVSSTYTPSYADIDAWNGDEGTGPLTEEKWTYWSLGFDTADEIEGAKKWFLLNNMKTTNANENNTPIYALNIAYGAAVNNYIRVGYSDNTTVLGGHVGVSHFQNNTAVPSTSEMGLVVAGQGNAPGGPGQQFGIHSETVGVSTDNSMCNGFSRKGHFWVDFEEVSSRAIAKRESPYAAARVTKIINAKRGIFEVDTIEPFKLDPDTEYVLYKEGTAFDSSSSPTWRSGLKVLERDDYKITVNKNCDLTDSGSNNLLTNTHIGNVWISPQKFWLNIAFLNKSATGQSSNLPERSWDSIIGVTGTGTAGATFNEYLYSTTTPWTNVFGRNLEPFDELDDNDVINTVDYGFGAYDDETDTGGYAGKVVLDYTTSSGMIGPHETLDISGIVDTLKPELGDTLPILLTTLSPQDTNVLSIHAEESSNEYDKPYLLTEFFDELPKISEFTVKPYEENSFMPHYQWSCDADDAWYGFLHIDSASIEHQYHNAVIHLPLNEEEITTPSHGRTVSSYPIEHIQGLTVAAPGTTRHIEGLAGYCMHFDGNDDYIEINAAAALDPTGDCTKEMSIVAHIIPDSASDDRYIIAQEEAGAQKFRIVLNANNQVEAKVRWDNSGSGVELTSTSIIPTDGETPTCVILTVDTELTSGNCKLFLNGKLEDISGRTTTSGSVNNWKVGESINGGNSALYVGANHDGSSAGFQGKIEEVVIYKKCIYPFSGKETEMIISKPFVEIDSTSNSSSLSQMGKIFIKDYHNIRGKTVTQVATAPAVSFRKAAFRLDNS